MTNEHDFETSVGCALHDVAQASSPAADLAERIIANATSGRLKVVPLRSARRFTVLLAAAACIVLIVGIVLGNQLLSSGQSNRPPATVQPTPTHLATRTMSSESRSAATGTTTSTATRSAAKASGAAGTTPSWLKQLPASTGAPHGFQPASIDFTDVNTGWVIGDGKCPTGDQTGCPALIHTTDGGTTWAEVSDEDTEARCWMPSRSGIASGVID